MDSIDFYKSKGISPNRQAENALVNAALRQSVVVDSARYDFYKSTMAGIIVSTKGDRFTFSYNVDTNDLVIKSVDEFAQFRAAYIYDRGTQGFDLIKAGPSGGGGGSPLPPAIPEEDNINDQQTLLTEEHPGAAVGLTPDNPNTGRQWHQETMKSLLDLGEDISKSVDTYYPQVSPDERQFLLEVCGKSPDVVDSPTFKMTPIEKTTFQKWLSKSVTQNYRPLSQWMQKRL